MTLVHTEETKRIISIAAKKTMTQSNAGFRQVVKCPLCHQGMSPANMGKHLPVCKKTRGLFLNGKELRVKEIKNLRRVLRPSGWTAEEYIDAHNRQNGRCFICGREEVDRRLSADHCHETNKPRRLLCLCCNTGIGAFRDNVQNMSLAIKYIESFRLRDDQ